MKWFKLKERGLLLSGIGSTVFVWILSLWGTLFGGPHEPCVTLFMHLRRLLSWIFLDLLYSIRCGRSDTVPVQSQALKKSRQHLLLCPWGPWVTVLETSCGGTVERRSKNTWRRIKEPSWQQEPCPRCEILGRLFPASSQVFEPSQLRC